MENILKPASTNKAARVTFYIFEIVAVVVAGIMLLMGLIDAINWRSFSAFISSFVNATINLFVLYGIGRVIDLLAAKNEK